jgi:hypothetical protein
MHLQEEPPHQRRSQKPSRQLAVKPDTL